jgi:sugar-specific transcriptional regulator TrmB
MKDTQALKPSNTTPKTPHSHAVYERLQASGMHHDQAMVYGYLVTNGPTRAGTIAAQTRLSATLVYRALEALESANLVTSNKRPGKVTLFAACDPRNLRDTVQSRKRALDEESSLIESLIPQLVQSYVSHGATTNFRYELGIEGIRTLARDINTASGLVYQYSDPQLLAESFSDLAYELGRDRHNASVTKVHLFPITDPRFTLPIVSDALTHIYTASVPRIPVVVLAYDHTLTLINLDHDNLHAISIQNPGLASFVIALFRSHWQVDVDEFRSMDTQDLLAE